MNGIRWAVLLFGLISIARCVTPTNPFYEIGLSLERRLSGLKATSIEVDGQTIAYLERTGQG